MKDCSYCGRQIRDGQDVTTIHAPDGVVYAHMHREDCRRNLRAVWPEDKT